MKRILFLAIALLWGTISAFGQMAVTAPTLELQEAMNHAEQMQQAVQSYQTMIEVKSGIDKGIEAIEKVNSKLKTVRDVQDIATRSASCIKKIQRVYEAISEMKIDPRYAADLLSQCNQLTRECVNTTAYGAKIFSSDFLKMSDAERLAETRRVLDDIDKLSARTYAVSYQAQAIKFNTQMLNAYFK